jgi:hypothetical protein
MPGRDIKKNSCIEFLLEPRKYHELARQLHPDDELLEHVKNKI